MNGKAALIPKATNIAALYGLKLGLLAIGCIVTINTIVADNVIKIKNKFLTQKTGSQAKL